MFLEILVVLLAILAIVLGVAVLLRFQEEQEMVREPRTVIVREPQQLGWGWGGGGWPLGPYYSHVPVRPILYG